MHYRHSFHAGNFADVFKHLVLCALLDALCAKQKPWFFLDTHAGEGRYLLSGESARRTGEYQQGIARLHGRDVGSAALRRLLELAPRAAGGDLARLYPGSPALAYVQARAHDRLAFVERIDEVADRLRDTLVYAEGRREAPRPTYAIHHRDGYETLGLLPPPEKRGLVLIDPPFERPDEFDAIRDYLRSAVQRFATGMYAVWYPQKRHFDAGRFIRAVAREVPRPALNLSFDTGAASQGQMHACGMVVVNPPFRLDAHLGPAVAELRDALAQGPRAAARMDWIRTEETSR